MQYRHQQATKRLRSVILVAMACAVLFGGSRVRAQTLYGSLVGNVQDETGAAVPGVEVRVTHEGTQQELTTITNEVGTYSFPTLRPGTYTVRATMPGFREFVQQGVLVTVNNVTRVNVTLQVGEITETITVSAQTALLQTDRAEVRAELDETLLENLPVPLGRNYQKLFGLLPGFRPPSEAHSIQTNPSRSLTFNVNGVSQSINNTRIDGVSTINPWLPHLTGYVPALESIQTVNVVTNSYDAEQGFAGGAAITVQLKSGTNDFRGTAFFTHHDNALRAKKYIFPYPEGLGKGKVVYNQFGGTFGGPIVRNRAFFFASYEGTTDHQLASGVYSIPSLQVRDGNFSGFSRVLYDPMTGNPDGTDRQPFPGNIIPPIALIP